MWTVQLKKVLSSIPEAPLNVECLMNDIDFRSSITREKFEELAAPVLARAHAPLEQVREQCPAWSGSLLSQKFVVPSSCGACTQLPVARAHAPLQQVRVDSPCGARQWCL